jgi:hypothetical protein
MCFLCQHGVICLTVALRQCKPLIPARPTLRWIHGSPRSLKFTFAEDFSDVKGMDRLSVDEHLHVMLHLKAATMQKMRIVCKLWCAIVDGLSQEEWKRIYHAQVCDWLRVGSSFDWKRAAYEATIHEYAICAWCVWSKAHVRVTSPWRVQNDVVLRSGVDRSLIMHGIDFVYLNTFSIRGIRRSCLQREDRMPCSNCASRSKRKCLKLRYQYYLRSNTTNQQALNECLARYLACTTAQNVPNANTVAAGTTSVESHE